MPDTVSKTDNFLKAIEKYAEEQRSMMRSEAEDFKQRELNTAEEEGLKEAYELLQKKMADINSKIAVERSRAESKSKKSIFIRRREIEDDVFKKAEEKLIKFTKSQKYESLLTKSAARISRVLPSDDVVIYMKEEDLCYRKRLRDYFGKNCEFAASEDIRIGGIMGLSRSLGLIADETLDTKLDQQHEWFYEHSGLTITEK